MNTSHCPPSFTDPHLSSPTDPITHRPPGRLSYRNNISSPLEHPYRSPTSASSSVHAMPPSADPSSRTVHYSPFAHNPQFSHNHPQQHSFAVTPQPPTPDSAPQNHSQPYHQPESLGGQWYHQAAYSHGILRSDSSSRAAPWAQGDPGPISNIPRIFVNSQESSQYPPSAPPPPFGASPRDNLLSSTTDPSDPSHNSSALHFRPDPRYNIVDTYGPALDIDLAATRNPHTDPSPPSQRPERHRSAAGLSVPILKLDTTGLRDHSASTSRDNFRSATLGTSPRHRGLTSPYGETPSPNPPSAGSSNPSPNSSTSSSMPSPSPGSSPMTFVPFQPGLNAQVAHVISEDKSITDSALREVFPPSSQCPPTAPPSSSGSPQNQPARKWICQWQGCGKSVRRQDRVAHALEHHGRKRFACSCGGSFARSQDKKRHLREQAICRLCPRSVGRNGYRGICPTCSQDHNNRAGRGGGGGGGGPYSA